MMTLKHCLAVLTTAFAIIGGGHAPSQAAGPQPGVCNPAAADALAGKSRISNRRAKRLTGATIVRQIKPGQGVTMDYRPERVTIETDGKTRKIVRAYCG
ncbi:MAG: I78 family peptidase inhibitor [Xanthobacteraceae bacterium]|nr:I78 family peptidase inhibitor [Xanthobacteraceae bacterium]